MLQIIRPAYIRQAECATAGVEMFVGTSAAKFERAAAVCAACPVARECVRDAFANEEEFGMRGGANFENADHRAAVAVFLTMAGG